MNRKELMEELLKLDLGPINRPYQQVADWVIADRKRICEPLINKFYNSNYPHLAIQETLKRAALVYKDTEK